MFAVALAARAQDPERADPQFVQYRLQIDAPSPVRDPVERSIGIARWRDYPSMTAELLERLAREAEIEAREAAATEGYFSAVATAVIDRTTAPWTVRVKVDPGEPTRIRSVEIVVTGAAEAADEEDRERIDRLRSDWRLPPGAVFEQGAWTAAKQRAVLTLGARHFAAARIADSEARIDPASRTADLRVVLDSGPRFYFGTLEIAGLSRYPRSRIRSLATFAPGDPYEVEKLDRFQRRLVGTGYFASVQVTADNAPDKADAAPVYVAVIEGPSKRLEVSLGYSTDVLFRTGLAWRDNDFLGRDWRLRSELRVDTRIQSLDGNIELPESRSGWADSFGGRVRRTDIENLVTQGVLVGVSRRWLDERNQPQVDLNYRIEREQPEGAPTATNRALYGELLHTWRRTDDLVAPDRGFVTRAQVGGAPPEVSTRAFGRAIVRSQYFTPLGRKNSLSLRAEAGAVIASTSEGIPQSLLFRTGGDTTVRGYDFESLGVQQGDAIVGGRYYGLASVEATRWITEEWGVAAFVDAGNAVDRASDFKFAVGYGVGVRLRTPIGPIRADIAYGVEKEQFRVHFSVGVIF